MGLFGALASWMMFATLDFKGGQLLIGLNQWSDYGPNTAIVQNFAFGHNFPAEYPHFASEPIRYHFLFYFLAGNLEFLGLSLVWSINILQHSDVGLHAGGGHGAGRAAFQIARCWHASLPASSSFTALLALCRSFARSGWKYLESIKNAGRAIRNLGAYLTSGYPYRGEDWGIWTQVVYINQRHLASSIGLFLIVLIFLFDRYLERARQKEMERALAVGDDAIPPPIGTSLLSSPGIQAQSEQIEQASAIASAGEAEVSGDLQSAQSFSEPETIAGSEAQPPDTAATPEELSPAANYASKDEATTFGTRAYDEYMRSEPGAISQSEVQEAEAHKAEAQEAEAQKVEAPEPAAPLSQESSNVSAVEAQSPEAAVPQPVSTGSRGMIAQFVHDNLVSGKSFIFCGLLLGALPYWNAPVFTAAAAVLAFLFVFFPYRRYMVGLAITAGSVGLPQVLALRAGNTRAGASLIHWGYTLGNVPFSQVGKYLWWTFGLKWVLILIGLLFFSWRNLRLFIAICSLFLLTFCFQFSDEALANHKFLNIWLVVANLFVAYGLWRLWHLR